MKKLKLFSSFYITAVFFATFFVSCNDDPSHGGIKNVANVHVNSWILENMDFWYLWNEKIPTKTDKNQEPDAYFESLLTPEDRFSWIQENYQELLNSLKGVSKEAGYEFVLYREEPGSEKVIAQILYVKTSSPASSAGLMRGDIITHINNEQITTSNYKTLLKDIKENHTLSYKSVNPDDETTGEIKTVSLNTIQYAENPNYLNTVIEVNGRKIGYYVYNLFAAGPDSVSNAYDEQVDNIFSQFKNQGITDLVLDLRFNSGGSESSANNLASLIGVGVTSSKVFARKEYNEGVEAVIKKDPDLGAGFLTSEFSNKSSNVGNLLTGGRMYVLTSSRTASASELVINSLKPFMDVFIIGDTTYGKNVGSISLYDKKDPKNSWGMQPIVVKVYNSLDQSDYGNGFIPDVLDKDNSIYLYPLGDPKEALLRHAIEQITGVATGGRTRKTGGEKQMVGHSLDGKRKGYTLTIDHNF